MILPTRTEFSDQWVGHNRMEVLEAYRREYLDPLKPPPLVGKNARNPHLQANYREAVAEIDAQYESLRRWLLANPQAHWLRD